MVYRHLISCPIALLFTAALKRKRMRASYYLYWAGYMRVHRENGHKMVV